MVAPISKRSDALSSVSTTPVLRRTSLKGDRIAQRASEVGVFESYFSVFGRDLELRSGDPAERLDFSRTPTAKIRTVARLDTRADEELLRALKQDDSPLERQRAAWELADRSGTDALPALAKSSIDDPDPTVRWSLLWLIQKHAGNDAANLIRPPLADPDPEVRGWAHNFIGELSGMPSSLSDPRSVAFNDANPFDQTLPLVVEGFGLINHPEEGWMQATFSPLWFESIVGRVMACTVTQTFDRTLIVEKRVRRYHPDGTDHVEMYAFSGFTFTPTPYIAHHTYDGVGNHTFYPAGKLEDTSLPPVGDVTVSVARTALTFRVPVPLTGSAQQRLRGHVVHSVRGRWMGPAFVHPGRLSARPYAIGAGEMQLSNLHHPIAGPLTNAFIYGTFKGKLSDVDGSGQLGINTEWCHGTVDGQLDFGLTGAPNPDPFDPFERL